MRTTIDLPDDLHRIAASIARDQRTTLSGAVVALIRKGLGQTEASGYRVYTSETTGLPVVQFGRPITIEDVRALDDEE